MSTLTRPLLVFVSGKPGAGKSTLARRLADTFAIPLVSRDALKIGLAEASAAAGDEAGLASATVASVYAFYGVIGYLLSAGVSLVAEQSFRRGLDERHLRPLTQRARLVNIHCELPVAEARRRFLTRAEAHHTQRAQVYQNPQLLAWFAPGSDTVSTAMNEDRFDWTVFNPLDLDVPTLHVATSSDYAPGLDAIVAFCQSQHQPTGGSC